MVCTYTNVAVDNLVEGFVNAGLDPVRIGYGQIKSTLQEHSLELKLEQHPLYPKYEVVSEKLEELEKDLKRIHTLILKRQEQGAPPHELSRLRIHRSVLYAKISRVNREKQAMYQQMQTEVLTSADVVRFSTFYTFGRLMCIFRYAPPASVLGLSR
jgi:hypothetical protein